MGSLLLVLALNVQSPQENQLDDGVPTLLPVPMPSPDEPLFNLDRRCPATALYVLARLRGKPVRFTEMAKRLEEPSNGVSANRLIQVAEQMGLPLDAVALRPMDLHRLKEPWIAFFQPCAGIDAGIGHYVVIRATETGSTIQVIDPPLPPSFASRERLFADNGWCRIAFVPRSTNRTPFWLVGAVLGVTGMVASILWVRRLQQSN